MASKDKQTGCWIAQWYEVDAYGKKKHRKKRGFKTMREAKQFEAAQCLKTEGDMDMFLEDFVEQYFEDKKNELKQRSIQNKRYMINQHILPYFGKLRMNEISPLQITKWQNEMYTKGFSESYLRMIQNQLTALFTHATTIYDLKSNPIKKVKRMGKNCTRELNFWTIDEYDQFITTIEPNTKYYVIFETLFWTGMRIGELLALTKNDIDFVNNKIKISKTYYRSKGEDIITPPKTEQSNRIIDIPNFLKTEIEDWSNSLYGIPDNARIFQIVAKAVENKLKRNIVKAKVKEIRVHDFRHSHASYLINQGVDALIIKERLGHTDIRITLNTYGHLYPNQQKKVADMLEFNRSNKKES